MKWDSVARQSTMDHRPIACEYWVWKSPDKPTLFESFFLSNNKNDSYKIDPSVNEFRIFLCNSIEIYDGIDSVQL